MFTFIPCFPHVLASHYEPAQSLDADVASRSRLKVTEEFSSATRDVGQSKD